MGKAPLLAPIRCSELAIAVINNLVLPVKMKPVKEYTMDYKQLATDVTIFLTPFLPYLILAAEESVKEVGKKFGEATWGKAKSIWKKITNSSSDTSPIQTFATTLAKNPNEIFQASLAQVLAEQLERSPQLATEILNMMKEDKAVQKILIEQQATAKNILQKLSSSGTQDVTVRGSTVGNITQIG